ncbi:MAG TPA: choice-of-anchor tandem repeat GloVer-containing protein [Candidatus Eremiobacteraceae bacterium]|nr:choice-of-anchor tandem repeat GloVer-containing protein [Candidatus Eremiobacteraceae bacterium]
MNRFTSFSLAIAALAAGLTFVATTSAAVAREEAIYRFTNVADGFGPLGLVADAEGDLYGTTYLGGPNTNCYLGCGTVFELSPPSTPGGKWTKTTIHAFNSDGVDGYQPTPTIFLADPEGNVYGTTYSGGAHNAGAVYELVPPIEQNEPWTEYILFSFQYGGTSPDIGDALFPTAGGGFYATTIEGGSAGGGTLSSLSPGTRSLKLNVLHAFDRQRNARPPGRSLVLDRSGNIYGIRFGMNGVCTPDFPSYCGTVYRFMPGTSKYDVLHRFEGESDGWFPNNELTLGANGHLFGTTQAGGAYTQGIVFELEPNKSGPPWIENIVLSLGADGDFDPLGGVVLGNGGSLFGTTSGNNINAGAVYRLSPPGMQGGSWTESILYRFSGGADGDMPNDQLTRGRDGFLYGTTYAGGKGTCSYYGPGCGVIFRVAP